VAGLTASCASDPISTAVFASGACPQPKDPGGPAPDLGPAAACGYLTVPEDRRSPTGRTVRLAVARVPAVSPAGHPDPIVYLEGGPGVSMLLLASRAIKAGVNADRDVIFLEQRGTLFSEPNLVCPEVEAFLAASVSEHFSAPSTGVQSDAATTACRDRLTASGVDLKAYTSAENAADVADLRVAMGIDQWNVYGTSYGSDLAQRVLRDHPAGIRSVVLDSVVPSNLNPLELFWPSFATAYQAMFETCAAQPACAAAYPDLAGELTRTVNRLTTSPLTVTVSDANGKPTQVSIDGYRLANLVGVVLAGGPSSAALVPKLVHEIATGDGTFVGSAVLSTTVLAPGINADGFTWSASCPDWTATTTPATILAKAKAALPQFPDTVLGLQPQLARYLSDCAIWNVGTSAASARAAVVSDVPVLLLGGTFDGVTATSWQDAVKPGLSKGQSVSFPGLGHTVVDQSPCAMSVMHAFLAAPTATVDPSCVARMTIPPFATS
jgi:pimeloyl-ACP methyl ester carboxylesterase